jgi:Peptidase M15
MPKLGSRTLALSIALSALATLLFFPVQGDASGSCLPRGLKSRLAQIKRKFGAVSIISTYRAGARMPNGRVSYHASCRAVDFNPPPGKYREVANWLKANHGGGVGTYSCGMHHIHIDDGPRVRFHHCQSAEVGRDIDVAAIRAARARWAIAGTTGVWPLVLSDKAIVPAAQL